ncbi:MAG: hypothetical protein A4S14_07495 [Proteobacteria bacterium SG_bin9]|nr:MAG: hypothetical protein A4S14_07495 [Proteobacteria bacterium SG_bin9]
MALRPARSRPDVLAHLRFRERADELRGLVHEELFTRIWRSNMWGAETSASGLGSEDAATAQLRAELPKLFQSLGIETLLDLPCGDFGWMSRADLGLKRYLGADIVRDLVDANQRRYAVPDGRISFVHLDLLTEALPAMDAILCRDCLVHLSFANIFRALENIRRSDCRYLITTTFVEHDVNEDAADGDWRLLNLQHAPFGFPAPMAVLNEGCTEADNGYLDKSLAVWRIADLACS